MNKIVRVKRTRPGDEVPAYCGRCKAERTHQVVALDAAAVPAQVICRTCGGQHRYRERSVTAPGAPSSRTTATRKPGRTEPEIMSMKPARAYSPRETYGENDSVEHPTFGTGVVTGVRGGKIEVRFGRETKVLVHAG